MGDVRNAAMRARPGDCITVMGDMNGRVARGIGGYTGQYCMHVTSDAGGKLMLDFMREFDLRAISTQFKPTRGSKYGNATYLPKSSTHGPAQLDYILVSRRWSSSVVDSKAKWGPSVHR